MGAFVMGWLAGESIICYRSIRDQHGPPWPGQMLAATGMYAIFAMIAEFGPGARHLAILLTWGMNIAAFLNLAGVARMPGATANNTWWKTVTSHTISKYEVWPSGTCSPSGSGSGSGSGSSSSSGSSSGIPVYGLPGVTVPFS